MLSGPPGLAGAPGGFPSETEGPRGSRSSDLLENSGLDARPQRHLDPAVDLFGLAAHFVVAHDILEDGLAGRPFSVIQRADSRGDHLSVLGMLDPLGGLLHVLVL